MQTTIRQWFENIDYLDIALWALRVALIGAVLWGTVATMLDNPYSTEQWLNFLVFGLAQGGLYALIALGYTLVYGVLLMINFAHGEFFMSGIFTATVFVAIPLGASGFTDRHPIWALLIITVVAIATSMGVAVLTERVAYRPLRRAPRLVPLITAIGASFFWQYFFRGLYGSGITAFPDVALLKGSLFLGKLEIFVVVIVASILLWVWSIFTMLKARAVSSWGRVIAVALATIVVQAGAAGVLYALWVIGGLEILRSQVVTIVASLLLLVGLYIFVMRTKMGKALRAVSENKDIAALMGIDVDRVIMITFAVGAAMAGAAGVLYALMYRQVGCFMGFFPGLKAFTAAVLGGIGSVPGAALGGLLLGMFESVGPCLFLEGLGITAPYQLKDVIAFTMLVLVLLVRPQGIMGEPLAEKKA